MGKRRHTAKTGDKGLYKQRPEDDDAAAAAAQKRRDADDDPMYNEVDRFHKDRDQDYLKFSDKNENENDESDNDVYRQDAVMNLGVGGDDSDDDDDVSSDDDGSSAERENAKKKATDDAAPSSTDDSSSSDDDDDDKDDDDEDENEDGMNVRDWGKRKSAYYHGDTADLEIGQEQDDALVEEEAAKEVQAARYKHMSEQDFNLSDTEEQDEEGEHGKEKKTTNLSSGKSSSSTRGGGVVLASGSSSGDGSGIGRLSKLSVKQQRKFLDRQHPELLPILSHFSSVVRNLHQRTNVATRALLESSSNNEGGGQSTAEAVGATKLGQQYLLSKALLESSTALNLAMYLLLKSEQHQQHAQEDEDQQDGIGNSNSSDVMAATTVSASASSTMIQSHPIMDRLQKLNALASKLEEQVEDKVPGLRSQIDNLVKASQFMTNALSDGDDEDDDEGSDNSAGDHNDSKEREDSDADQDESEKPIATSKNDDDDDEKDDEAESSSDDEEEEKKAIAARNALNEARFSLRLGEVSGTSVTNSRKNRGFLQKGALPFGDDDDDEDGGISAGKHLAATLNAIEQRRSSATNREKRRAEAMTEHLDGPNQDDDDNKNYYNDGDDDNNEDDPLQRGLDMMEADLAAKGADEDEDGDDDDNGGDDFYAQVQRKSRAKKAVKQQRYTVAPKFPRLEPEGEDGQQRAVSQSILKNRGLVPHKPKINRNPRVKKRKQFDQALIRRRGAVRDVRAPQEGHQYGGEQTGIKSSISRSRKL